MFNLPEFTGPFVVAIVGCTLAVVMLVTLLRVRRDALDPFDDGVETSNARIRDLWRSPRAQAALVALATTQTVMVLIMAMTPVHLRSTHHGLGTIGWVIGVHVFGMYGLSPISGRLADRFGPIRMILAGFGTLMAAGLSAAAAPNTAGVWLVIPLFLLGFGWSLSFVSGSALLTLGLSYADRARLQGSTDLVVWTSAGIAGLSSGVLVGTFGYALLCVVGAVLVIAPIVLISGRRQVLVTSS